MSEWTERLRVLFIHGKESSPHGAKGRRLAEQFDVYGEQMDTADFEGSVSVQAEAVARFSPQVVVGSSFGGAVLCALLKRGLYRGPSLLLAPATRLYDPQVALPRGRAIVIVHGIADDVVPIELSRALAASAPGVVLHEVEDDHRLSATVESGRLFDHVREAYALETASA